MSGKSKWTSSVSKSLELGVFSAISCSVAESESTIVSSSQHMFTQVRHGVLEYLNKIIVSSWYM